MSDAPDHGTACAWVEHLRAGGTTGWSDFAATGRRTEAEGRVPGAQQLEVLRRLNLLRAERGAAPDPVLTRDVLAASPSGRAALDVPLRGLPTPGYGVVPADPADLTADQLLRVVTGVLADRLVASPIPQPPEPTRWDRARDAAAERLPRRRPFRLVGPTARVDPVRRRLRDLGLVPGGRGAVHYVLGADAGRLVTDAWTSRVIEGTAPPWPEWLLTWVERDTCPPRADLAAIAHGWATRRGAEQVAVVLDVAELSGLLDADGPVEAPGAPPAAAVELVRGVSAVLGVLVDRDHRTGLLTEVLAPRLAAAEGPPLVVGGEHRDWLVRHGRQIDQAVREGGYRVHGPSGLLTDPPLSAGTAAPDDDEVLRVALGCLDEWPASQPGTEVGA